MYLLICTSYTETEHGLVLRNNWTENVNNDIQMLSVIQKWDLPKHFKYPSKGQISSILVGRMELDNVHIHVRIVKF